MAMKRAGLEKMKLVQVMDRMKKTAPRGGAPRPVSQEGASRKTGQSLVERLVQRSQPTEKKT